MANTIRKEANKALAEVLGSTTGFVLMGQCYHASRQANVARLWAIGR